MRTLLFAGRGHHRRRRRRTFQRRSIAAAAAFTLIASIALPTAAPTPASACTLTDPACAVQTAVGLVSFAEQCFNSGQPCNQVETLATDYLDNCVSGATPICAEAEALPNTLLPTLTSFASSCLGGSNPTCNQVVPLAEAALALVVTDAEQCIQGTSDICNTLVWAAQQIAQLALSEATSCASGSNAICQFAVQEAYALADLVAGTATTCASGSNSTCNMLVSTAAGLAGSAVSTATACANGSDSTCYTAVQTAEGAVGLAVATAQSCVGGTNSVCSSVVPTVTGLASIALGTAQSCVSGQQAVCAQALGTLEGDLADAESQASTLTAPLAFLSSSGYVSRFGSLPPADPSVVEDDYYPPDSDPLALPATRQDSIDQADVMDVVNSTPQASNEYYYGSYIWRSPWMSELVPYRNGWHDPQTTNGFGRTHCQDKHNFYNPRLLRATIEEIQPYRGGKFNDRQVFDAWVTNRTNPYYDNATREIEYRIVVDDKDVVPADNHIKGVITCIPEKGGVGPYNEEFPEWVNHWYPPGY